MRKLAAGLVGATFTMAMATGGLAPAGASPPPASKSATSASTVVNLQSPWAREESHFGDRDVSPYDIAHIRELQFRLKWEGMYPGTPTGTFGTMTRGALKRYQTREHIVVSGVATTRTWVHLLHDTIRHPHQVPGFCQRAGWHACYDRSMHQLILFRDGSIYNTWLVRGGASYAQTRLGTHRVYYRDIDHWSTLYGSPMPYSQFFDGGEALHGSRLMMNPFVDHSHGCVNMYVEDARQLWNLTVGKVLWVTVYGHWA